MTSVDQTSEDRVAEIMEVVHNAYLKPGLGHTTCVQNYTDTSKEYEEYMSTCGYRGPRVGAETVARLYHDRSIKILDVAAGTGLAGEELRMLGFVNIDALDPSEGMLRVAEEKHIYINLYLAHIDERRLAIDDNVYDVILIVGGMGENQIPSSGFDEMVRIVKPGGRIINVTRQEHFSICEDYVENLGPIYKRLTDEGKWALESVTNFPDFLRGKEGVVYVHRIL